VPSGNVQDIYIWYVSVGSVYISRVTPVLSNHKTAQKRRYPVNWAMLQR